MVVSISKLKRDLKFLDDIDQGLNRPCDTSEKIEKITKFYEQIKDDLQKYGKVIIKEGKYTQLKK